MAKLLRSFTITTSLCSLLLTGCQDKTAPKAESIAIQQKSQYQTVLDELARLGIPTHPHLSFEKPDTNRIVIYSPDDHDLGTAKQIARLRALAASPLRPDVIDLEGFEGLLSQKTLTDQQAVIDRTKEDAVARYRVFEISSFLSRGLKLMPQPEALANLPQEQAVNYVNIANMLDRSREIMKTIETNLFHYNASKQGVSSGFHEPLELTLQQGIPCYGIENKEIFARHSVELLAYEEIIPVLNQLRQLQAYSSQLRKNSLTPPPLQSLLSEFETQLKEKEEKLAGILEKEHIDPHYKRTEQQHNTWMFDRAAQGDKHWIAAINQQPGRIIYVIGGEGHVYDPRNNHVPSSFYIHATEGLRASLITLKRP